MRDIGCRIGRIVPFSMRRPFLIVSVLLLAGALSSCGRPVLPEGPQEVEGKLERVPLSLTRRGTHLLKDLQGEDIAYAESTAINLGTVQGDIVTLQGIYDYNINPRDLPVFVVQKVLKGGENTLKHWELPFFASGIDVPAFWEGGVAGTVASFHEPASTEPVLEIMTGSASTLPFDFKTFSASGTILKVTPVVVGLKRAASILDEKSGTWTVYVDASSPSAPQEKRILVLRFALAEEAAPEEQIARFQRFVRTLKFAEKPKPPATAQPATGSGATKGDGQPCGGPAGILCPAGYYCQITDQAISSGVCRKR